MGRRTRRRPIRRRAATDRCRAELLVRHRARITGRQSRRGLRILDRRGNAIRAVRQHRDAWATHLTRASRDESNPVTSALWVAAPLPAAAQVPRVMRAWQHRWYGDA